MNCCCFKGAFWSYWVVDGASEGEDGLVSDSWARMWDLKHFTEQLVFLAGMAGEEGSTYYGSWQCRHLYFEASVLQTPQRLSLIVV